EGATMSAYEAARLAIGEPGRGRRPGDDRMGTNPGRTDPGGTQPGAADRGAERSSGDRRAEDRRAGDPASPAGGASPQDGTEAERPGAVGPRARTWIPLRRYVHMVSARVAPSAGCPAYLARSACIMPTGGNTHLNGQFGASGPHVRRRGRWGGGGPAGRRGGGGARGGRPRPRARLCGGHGGGPGE